jgi:hypothetical protein
MIDPAHPHARGRLAGKAQDVASGYRIAELLGLSAYGPAIANSNLLALVAADNPFANSRSALSIR